MMKNPVLLGSLVLPFCATSQPAFAVDYLSLAQAQQTLFPAGHFVDASLNFSDAQRDAIKARAGSRQRSARQQIWQVSNDQGAHLGWFLLDEVIGKHEFITYAVALTAQGQVAGLEILSYRETHGGQVRAADWRAHFTGKALADPLKLGRDIPNISGATLSCRNLTDGVRRLVTLWNLYLRAA